MTIEEYCQLCKFWVLWNTKKGKDIFNCRIGQKPTGSGDKLFCKWRQFKKEFDILGR